MKRTTTILTFAAARYSGYLSERAPIHSFVAAHNNLLSIFVEGKKNGEFLPGMTSESYFLFGLSALRGTVTPKGKDELEKIIESFSYHSSSAKAKGAHRSK